MCVKCRAPLTTAGLPFNLLVDGPFPVGTLAMISRSISGRRRDLSWSYRIQRGKKSKPGGSISGGELREGKMTF